MLLYSTDPEERDDVAAANPDIVKKMLARIDALAASEVSIAASDLCPFSTGTHSDPQCGKKAEQVGFWMPWCDEGFTCTPKGQPTPPPAPSPPAPPTPKTCTSAQRKAPAAAMAEVRADKPEADAASKQAWDMTSTSSTASTYMVMLRADSPSSPLGSFNGSALCMGVNGATKKNPSHGQIKLLLCNNSDPTQLWTKMPQATGFTLHQGSRENCMDLQQADYNMEVTKNCKANANQVFVYTESTGRIAFAHDNGKVLDVC
jgi:hypothetical protein